MEKRRQLGRDAFINEQGSRWDRFYTRPHHVIPSLAAGVFGTIVVFGAYELLVLVVSSIFKK